MKDRGKLSSHGSNSILQEFRPIIKRLQKMGARIIVRNKHRLAVAGKEREKKIEVVKSGVGGNQTIIRLITATFSQEVVVIPERILPEDVEKILGETS